MKIVFHEDFKRSDYSVDPAAAEGRIEVILDELESQEGVDFVSPEPVSWDDLKLVHTSDHVSRIERKGDLLFRLALLAAGGATKAAEIAYNGEPSFAVIRPPGHHASPDSSWGFCYFNNMGIALEKLRNEGKIESAYILDFDLHMGDGNINSVGNKPGIHILNPSSKGREDYLNEISEDFERVKNFDIIGVSAGFDEHVEDWGGKLTTSDYEEIGKMVKDFSEEKCNGRRFAILEGGYNHMVLGKNVASFVKGFRN